MVKLMPAKSSVSLKLAFRPGMGQHIPDRLFWARDDDDSTGVDDDGEPQA